MKLTRKLIPAVAMLIISAVMMSTASFAWFTTNTTVTANGINFTTVAPINILISDASKADDYKALVQFDAITGAELVPASNADPLTTNFFAPVGAANFGVTGGAVDTDSAVEFQAVTQEIEKDTNGYYKDYDLKMMLSSGAATPTDIVNIKVNSLTITQTSGGDGKLKDSVRVAVIVKDSNDGAERLLAVFAANNETSTTKAIAELDTDNTVKTLTNVDAVASSSEVIELNQTNIATITLRVWIEGQDPDCVNAAAANSFSVAVVFGYVAP